MSSLTSVAVLKHSGQKQLEEERHSLSRAGAMRCSPIKASHSTGFLRQPRPPAQGMASPTMDIIEQSRQDCAKLTKLTRMAPEISSLSICL